MVIDPVFFSWDELGAESIQKLHEWERLQHYLQFLLADFRRSIDFQSTFKQQIVEEREM